jgi:hypothetical protein
MAISYATEISASYKGAVMLKKSVILLISAVVITLSINEARAGFPLPPMPPAPPNVNVRVDGYLPAPPGVNIQIDSGRPYYVEHERRVYIERETSRKYKKRKKHHDNHGNKYGHDKQERRGHGRHND